MSSLVETLEIEKPVGRASLGRLFLWLDAVCVMAPPLVLLWALSRTSDPSGVNGYFYLKQTETIANLHELYFKDRSLAFAPLVLLYKLTGSSLLAFRLGIAGTSAALLAGLRALIFAHGADAAPGAPSARDARDPAAHLAFWLAAASCCLSLHLIEFSLTFFKNFFAFAWLIWALALQYRRPRAAGACLAVALLSHKSMFLLAVVFAGARALRGLTWHRLLLGSAALAGLLGLFALTFERATAYLRALTGFISPTPVGLNWVLARLRSDPGVLAIYATAAAFLLLYPVLRRRLDARARAFGGALFALVLIAGHPFQAPGASGPAYRLLILLPVLLAAGFATLALQARRSRWAIAACLAVLAIQLPQARGLNSRLIARYVPRWSPLRADAIRIRDYVRPEDHLTSHHGLEFFIDYVTGIRSRSFLSEHPEKADFRLAYAPSWLIEAGLARDELNQAKLADFGANYVLIPEADWTAISRRYLVAYHWKNPEAHRPAHIYE